MIEPPYTIIEMFAMAFAGVIGAMLWVALIDAVERIGDRMLMASVEWSERISERGDVK